MIAGFKDGYGVGTAYAPHPSASPNFLQGNLGAVYGGYPGIVDHHAAGIDLDLHGDIGDAGEVEVDPSSGEHLPEGIHFAEAAYKKYGNKHMHTDAPQQTLIHHHAEPVHHHAAEPPALPPIPTLPPLVTPTPILHSKPHIAHSPPLHKQSLHKSLPPPHDHYYHPHHLTEAPLYYGHKEHYVPSQKEIEDEFGAHGQYVPDLESYLSKHPGIIDKGYIFIYTYLHRVQ